jgi:hypothetical protein
VTDNSTYFNIVLYPGGLGIISASYFFLNTNFLYRGWFPKEIDALASGMVYEVAIVFATVTEDHEFESLQGVRSFRTLYIAMLIFLTQFALFLCVHF